MKQLSRLFRTAAEAALCAILIVPSTALFAQQQPPPGHAVRLDQTLVA